MSFEDLDDAVNGAPFAQFDLLLGGGTRVRIVHPDFIWLHPNRRSVVVATKAKRTLFLDTTLLLGIERRAEAHGVK